jgi:signal transduction histidine kinase
MDILLEQASSPEKVKNIAKLTKNAANKGFEALQKYMVEARKLTNPVQFKKETADLSKIVKSVIQQNEPSAHKKKQIIQTSLPDKLVCKADPKKMAELVDNLLNNAIKYSPQGKNIYIELAKDLQFSTLIVRDYGQGMTKEDLKKAFIRYQTLSAKPTGEEKAHGLGLWIVKAISEQHGGSVTVHSEGRDKGCQFEVKIPLK